MERPLILVTNDDGITSPGLAAAVAALDPLGELLIVAPANQQTSMGRSRTQHFGLNGRLFRKQIQYNGQAWEGFAANATPAVTVEHAVHELATRPIQLAVSGINYGENIGTCVTVSGTLGAAFEAAERGIPALAVSLETSETEYFNNDEKKDFRAAGHFVRLFASLLLDKKFPPDVDVLKIEIPASATVESGWVVTRQDRLSYYRPSFPKRDNLFNGEASLEHHVSKGQFTRNDTDAYALAQGLISVTPLSLDLTSRLDLAEVEKLFKSSGGQ
jgi:5'-nucleotidase